MRVRREYVSTIESEGEESTLVRLREIERESEKRIRYYD